MCSRVVLRSIDAIALVSVCVYVVIFSIAGPSAWYSGHSTVVVNNSSCFTGIGSVSPIALMMSSAALCASFISSLSMYGARIVLFVSFKMSAFRYHILLLGCQTFHECSV